jgi:hypothetical protein
MKMSSLDEDIIKAHERFKHSNLPLFAGVGPMSKYDFEYKRNIYGIERDLFLHFVKLAFVEAGWYHSLLVEYQMGRIESGKLMTGQEWYDRFQREYHRLLEVPESTYIDSLSTDAAKRASGISND